MFDEMNMWFENWFNFDLISQWISLSRKYFDIDIKSLIDVVFFICHLIIICDKIKFKFVVSINFNSWFAAACCVKRDESHHNEWCKLKSFNNTCSALICSWRSIIDNVTKLSVKIYNTNDGLYTLWIWVILADDSSYGATFRDQGGSSEEYSRRDFGFVYKRFAGVLRTFEIIRTI